MAPGVRMRDPARPARGMGCWLREGLSRRREWLGALSPVQVGGMALLLLALAVWILLRMP